MSTAEADAQFRAWMRDNLTKAAEHFTLTITGEPTLGWLDRSISAPVQREGQDYWLRVVSEDPKWTHMEFWTGNRDANVLAGLPKPHVLDAIEWDEHRRQRAELMTRLTGDPCSPTDVLREQIELSPQWWSDLRHSLNTLAASPTHRIGANEDRANQRLAAAFGEGVTVRFDHWTTAHGDLHWANLLGPRLGILDWEHWGQGPAGLDAATLLCYSLLVPTMARTVHEVFADILDTPAGRTAQLCAIARLLFRASNGEHPDLTEPLKRHANNLLNATGNSPTS